MDKNKPNKKKPARKPIDYRGWITIGPSKFYPDLKQRLIKAAHLKKGSYSDYLRETLHARLIQEGL